MDTIRIADIASNRNYIRQEMNKDKVLACREVIRGNGGKWPESFNAIPVTVRPIDDIAGYHYEMADGFHRTLAAKQEGIKTIPVVIRKMDEQTMDVLQFNANTGHGTNLDPTTRHRWVRYLAEHYHMAQAVIARECHLTQPSVSRILSGKQSGAGRKAAEAKRTKTTARGNVRASRPGQPWALLLHHTITAFEDHTKSCLLSITKLDPDKRKMLKERFGTMADALNKVFAHAPAGS